MTTIKLSSTGLQINSVPIELPVSINTLKKCLNYNYRTVKGKSNTVLTWDDLGILAYSKNGELIESLTLELEPEAYDFSPKKKFSGKFYFNDKEITNYYKTHKEERIALFNGDDGGALVQNNISAWFSVRRDQINAIEISEYKPFIRWEGIPEDKYSIKPLDEEVLTFTDFGFKLSIIEELMYMKGLIKPQFDIYEFAK